MTQRILVVDDDHDLIQLYKIVFQMAGLNVVGTTSGIRAIKEVKDNGPELILLDVMMPEISGVDVCLEIRKMPLEKQPIIFMYSANDSQENRERCLAAGADQLLSKGMPIDDVTEVVKQALHHGSSFAAAHDSRI